ncbi:hypothetical protein [Parajeilongvirus brazilense]|nr:hypothetical protein [Diaemus bat paramyxovirus]
MQQDYSDYVNMDSIRANNQVRPHSHGTYYGSTGSRSSRPRSTRIYRYINLHPRINKENSIFYVATVLILLIIILIGILMIIWLSSIKSGEILDKIIGIAQEESLIPKQEVKIAFSKIDHILNILSFRIMAEIKEQISRTITGELSRTAQFSANRSMLTINFQVEMGNNKRVGTRYYDPVKKRNRMTQRDHLIITLFELLNNWTTSQTVMEQCILDKEECDCECQSDKNPHINLPKGPPGSHDKGVFVDDHSHLNSNRPPPNSIEKTINSRNTEGLSNDGMDHLYKDQGAADMTDGRDEKPHIIDNDSSAKKRRRYYPWMNTYIYH